MTFTGALGSAGLHAHAAVQVLDLQTGAAVLRDRAGRECRVTGTAVIPTMIDHEILATPGTIGSITYLDPSTPEATDLRGRGTDVSGAEAWICPAPDSLHAADDPAQLHPVLRLALDTAAGMINGPLPLPELAAAVGMSPSRLGHLFQEQLGLTFPVWRRWARLQHALSQVADGTTLTAAAHDSGFADSAHLTRACRAMFGITPSQAITALRQG
ncbi:helix-turn-helix domain-containing protein [Kribbella sp. NPDC050124]|uniref:helix-turn-helix domain-containing protein n=1 Tax=Kribbella sp. NPDC050124 TaxID=3364114 RepID=UPI0037B1C8FE